MKNLPFAGRRIGARSILSPQYIVVSQVTPILTPLDGAMHKSCTPLPDVWNNEKLLTCSTSVVRVLQIRDSDSPCSVRIQWTVMRTANSESARVQCSCLTVTCRSLCSSHITPSHALSSPYVSLHVTRSAAWSVSMNSWQLSTYLHNTFCEAPKPAAT
jgi:hypothetical protein